MNNRLISAGIFLVLIAALVFIVFGTNFEKKESDTIVAFKSVRALVSEDRLAEAKERLDKIASENPDLDGLGEEYFKIARYNGKKKNIVKARDIYNIILDRYQNVDNILEVQEELGRLNVEILFSSLMTDQDVFYTVGPGDTLLKIAKKFGTTVDLIKKSNSLKSDMIKAHSKLKVSKAQYGIMVDKSQNILTVFSDGDVFKVYRVSTGENNSTPVGTFKIVNKIKDPVWYNEGAVVPAESPDNILGSRWLGISESGYGIHGTIEPKSVGRQTTKGCVRMFNADVEELYTVIPINTEVVIVD